MKLLYITPEHDLYAEAVDLRVSLFFQGIDNASDLINDQDETNSLHLVYLQNKKVIGTGRLTLKNDTAIISQMAISQHYQNRGIGRCILLSLIEKSIEFNAKKIELSARKTAVNFYRKFDFIPLGEFYPSKKTGVIHQNMQRSML